MSRAKACMAVVRSSDGRWSYGPLAMVVALRATFEYGGEYDSAAAATGALRRDPSVPRGAEVFVYRSVANVLDNKPEDLDQHRRVQRAITDLFIAVKIIARNGGRLA